MSFEGLGALMAKAPEGRLAGLPYAETLDLSYRIEGEAVTLVMPYAKSLIGSPVPPRLHGGAVAGLMEIAAIAQLVHTLRAEAPLPGLKPINVTVDYLRAGQTETTYAAASIVRLGRRIANINVEAWQTGRARPIAAAHMHVMLVREAGWNAHEVNTSS